MVIIERYDETWPDLYAAEREKIVRALGPYIIDIQHIGSTSVPGLAAKPIVDIGINLNVYPLPDEAIAAMEALGYEHMGEYGIPGRHYFRKGDPRKLHVHAYAPGNPEYDAQILFCDYLRAHPDAASEYAELKRGLATRHSDRSDYTDGKTGFVHATLAKAREWRATSSPDRAPQAERRPRE